MESGEQSQHLVTHWPGVKSPVPAVFRLHVWLVDNRVLVYGLTEKEPLPQTVHLPDELYLRRFLPLDVANPEEVHSFSADYGMIGNNEMTDIGWVVHHAAFASTLDSSTSFSLGRDGVRGAWRVVLREGHVADWQQTGEEPWTDTMWCRSALAERGVAPLPLFVLGVQTVEEVSIYHAVLSEMFRLWRELSGQLSAASADAERAATAPRWRLRFSGATSDLLAAMINPALSPFHVRLETGSRQPLDVDAVPNVYQAMCLQLANHIAENAAYRLCAAEGCNRLFVRTEGYSRYGHNRTRGNKFCSMSCANRQHQREYRRRQRAKAAKP